MFKVLRIIIRLSLLSAHLITGVLLALLFLTAPLKSFGLYNEKTLIRKWLFVAGYLTGCRIDSDVKPINSPTLLISNHISWLDILIIGGSYDLHFLSKEEVKKWPVVGFLTVISGTLLIKRGSGSQGAIDELQHALNNGDNVGLFPEGTTSDGKQVKPFHSRLLKAAYLANTSISLISLSYSSNKKTRDQQMGWEKQSFFEHLFYVLSQKRSYVKIHLVDELKDFHEEPRKTIAQQSRQRIKEDLDRNHYPSDE